MSDGDTDRAAEQALLSDSFYFYLIRTNLQLVIQVITYCHRSKSVVEFHVI